MVKQGGLNLKPPSWLKQFLEKAGVREVTPSDICSGSGLEKLYEIYPDLAGDQGAIGWGDEGNCQSWRRNPGWWRELVGEGKSKEKK